VRHVFDRLVAGQVEERFVVGVDQEEPPMEAGLQHVAGDGLPERTRAVGGADDADGTRFEQRLEIMGLFHDVGPRAMRP